VYVSPQYSKTQYQQLVLQDQEELLTGLVEVEVVELQLLGHQEALVEKAAVLEDHMPVVEMVEQNLVHLEEVVDVKILEVEVDLLKVEDIMVVPA